MAAAFATAASSTIKLKQTRSHSEPRPPGSEPRSPDSQTSGLDTLSKAAAVMMATSLVIPTAILTHALWSLDLSLVYVADHARAGVSGLYRVAGLWGGANGSLLMFTCMVAVTVAAMLCTHQDTRKGYAAQNALILGALSVGALACAVLFTANPFRELLIPAIDGGGLQPILEHPAMIYHPPLLYAGQVSTAIPFLIATSTPLAMTTSAVRDYTAKLRYSLGVSLALLTLGLATGSNWAYVELGWGGFWGWDPVENGILVAWIFITAALHAVRQSKHIRMIRLLCALPWIFVLVASAVTRAGIGGSIHAFADDERVAWILLGMICATATFAVFNVMFTSSSHKQTHKSSSHKWTHRSSPRKQTHEPLFGDEVKTRATAHAAHASHVTPVNSAITLNSDTMQVLCVVLSVAAAIVVLAGVLYPIPASGEPLVTGRYYATALAPFAIFILIGSVIANKKQITVFTALGAFIGVIAAAILGVNAVFPLLVAAGAGILIMDISVSGVSSVKAVLRTHQARMKIHLADTATQLKIPQADTATQTTARKLETRKLPTRVEGKAWWRVWGVSGMWFGHIGFAVLMIGVAGATMSERVTVGVRLNEEVEVGGLYFRHIAVNVDEGFNTDEGHMDTRAARGSSAVVSTLEIRQNAQDDELVAILHPALVAYPERSVLLAETALHSTPMRDIQVALRNADDSGITLYDISVSPLTMWVWWGSALMTCAAVLIAIDRHTSSDKAHRLSGKQN